MDYSSSDSAASESEVPELAEKVYLELKSGKHKVKIANGIYRCPFCIYKKRQEYNYKELVQHSTGIGSRRDNATDRAKHLSLARYLEEYMNEEAGPSSQKSSKTYKKEVYVYPWMGILVNLYKDEVGDDGQETYQAGSKLKEQLSNFNPLKVVPLWSHTGPKGSAVVIFRSDWNGFEDAGAFENYFKEQGRGKWDWYHQDRTTSKMYGWLARADDYNSTGKLGEFLRIKGDLKTVSDMTGDEDQQKQKMVTTLGDALVQKTSELVQLKTKHESTTIHLKEMTKV
ncbi:protein INVOLVED IN DE NOVO 2-like [Phalaenopsis equestris]|uniref:protein INVOLVED IN DE NOVO 2-like n=1 Tax=Phalaenopsis equestris TaxID=78828 RepID=UPI0009E26DD7|nr:protein INVOLVED IN DE NOVO 2-like [Phalaenopsis equestris]